MPKKSDEPSAEEMKISLGNNSISLRIEAGTIARLSGALVDLISSFSETFGVAGDAVGRYRLAKREAAAATLMRAQELRLGTSREGQKVAQKILDPIMEGASREDLGENNVLELWARVLSKSPTQFDSKFAIFADILGKIGPDEAEFFIEFMNKIDMGTFRKLDILDSLKSSFVNKSDFESVGSALTKIIELGRDKYVGEILTKFGKFVWDGWEENDLINDACMVELFMIRTGGQTDFIGQRQDGNLKIEILERVGLMVRKSYSVISGKIDLRFEYFEPSQLAFELYQCIQNENLDSDLAEDGDEHE